MQWTDSAIVISTRKYGESSAIVSLLTRESGLFNGFVRGIAGKANRGTFQMGNLIEATWRGRLSEQLGGFTAELTAANAAMLLSDQEKLLALSAICSLLEATLSEREPCADIFMLLEDFISKLKTDDGWYVNYAMFEVRLLAHLGFGLDLSECVATGTTENLIYISPKSGCAVSAEAGMPYKDKLFSLPALLQNSNSPVIKRKDVENTLDICGYFLEKNIFAPHNARLPDARGRFLEMMK